MTQFCIYFLVVLLLIEIILIFSWGISRNMLFRNLEKTYPNKIPILFVGLSNPKDLNRTYGLGKHIIKFEKMIYNKDKILKTAKRKTFLVAYISGILFYPSLILIPSIMFFCATY